MIAFRYVNNKTDALSRIHYAETRSLRFVEVRSANEHHVVDSQISITLRFGRCLAVGNCSPWGC
jgi:hypothetical protein